MTAFRIVAVAAVVGTASALLLPAFLALRSMGTKVFEPQPFDYTLLGASMFAIGLGAQVVPWRGARYVAFLAMIASGLLLFGFLAAFSIGLPFLPAGLVLLLVLYRAVRRGPASTSLTRAALGGAAIGFALPLLYIALSVPATAECFPNGGGMSSGRWGANGQMLSSSGSTSVDRNGVVTGRGEYPDSVVTFRCEAGRIVEFQRTAR
jgi:hypothetical protein